MGAGDRMSSQSVIGSQLEHKDIDGSIEQPIDASQSSGGGITTYAGVHHGVVEAFLIQLLLNECRERSIFTDSISSSDAVTHKQDCF